MSFCIVLQISNGTADLMTAQINGLNMDKLIRHKSALIYITKKNYNFCILYFFFYNKKNP